MRWLLLLPALLAAEELSMLAGSFDMGVEALYWKPTTGGYDYAREMRPGVTDVEPLSPDYDWGVRIGGRYLAEYLCTYFSVGGLYYAAEDSARTRGTDLEVAFSDAGMFSVAVGRLQYDYWNVDFKAGHYLHWTGGIAFHMYAGALYADVVERQKVRADEPGDPRAIFRQKLEFWGLGPQVGVGGMTTWWNYVRVFGELGAAALIGEQRTHFLTNEMGMVNDRRFGSTTVIVPMIQSSLGFATSLAISQVVWTLAIGYELHHFLDVFRAIPAFNLGTARFSRNVGFAGPYLSVVGGF